jgi:hypothetical protein
VATPRVDALHRRVTGNIRALADTHHVPLSHLPDRAVVGRSHFWNVMAGKKSPTLRWLGKVAKALEVDVEDLVSRG